MAAKQAGSTTPVVIAVVGDAVASGVVASLARPGGNVTGLTFFQPELNVKRLELLKEAVPDMTDVGVLLNPGNQMNEPVLPQVERMARSLGVTLHQFGAREPAEFDNTFAAMVRGQVRGFVVFDDAMLIGNAPALASLALKYRLSSCGFPDFATGGGLLAYGVDFPDLFRRSAAYVDKILKGAKPADLPVEQATRFETILNLKTAKALGIDVPSLLLTRADQVIE
jgi:putative ABC transport system substrate-binding protein